MRQHGANQPIALSHSTLSYNSARHLLTVSAILWPPQVGTTALSPSLFLWVVNPRFGEPFIGDRQPLSKECDGFDLGLGQTVAQRDDRCSRDGETSVREAANGNDRHAGA